MDMKYGFEFENNRITVSMIALNHIKRSEIVVNLKDVIINLMEEFKEGCMLIDDFLEVERKSAISYTLSYKNIEKDLENFKRQWIKFLKKEVLPSLIENKNFHYWYSFFDENNLLGLEINNYGKDGSDTNVTNLFTLIDLNNVDNPREILNESKNIYLLLEEKIKELEIKNETEKMNVLLDFLGLEFLKNRSYYIKYGWFDVVNEEITSTLDKKISHPLTLVNGYFRDGLEHLLSRGTYSRDMGDVQSKFEDGTPAHTIFDTMINLEYDLSKNEFPICTYRKTATMMGIKEILWIYQDQSNDLNVLEEKYNVPYWNKFDIGDRTIGNRYGYIAKKHNIIRDKVINVLKEHNTNRRAIIDLWQYEDMASSAGLDSCAFNAIFMVRGEYLDLMLNQRSCDFITAWSINEIQYVALQMMIAYELKLKPGKFVHNIANLHIYEKHKKAADELLMRSPSGKQPILKFEPVGDKFEDFTFKDFKVENYEPCLEPVEIPLAIGKMK